ncbi:Serine/threonine-protein kinase pim-1, partial [Acanthisitta chloris]
PAGMKEDLQQHYQLGSLLGSGSFGVVYAGMRRSDGIPVALKLVARESVMEWGQLRNGTCAPMEIVLLEKVGSGCPRIIKLLEWHELQGGFVLVMERP